jgi:hypothetical protein
MSSAAVAVPPGVFLHRSPEHIAVHGVLADQQRRQAIHDGLRGARCFRPLRNGLAPAHLAVIGLHADQAQMA